MSAVSEFDAVDQALSATRERLEAMLAQAKPPWTAIASMTRLEADLLAKRSVLSHADAELAPMDAEEVRAGILALDDEMLEVAAAAVQERRAAGSPILLEE